MVYLTTWENFASAFTEESCVMGDFSPSITGKVTAPVADSRATALVEAGDAMSSCRARL